MECRVNCLVTVFMLGSAWIEQYKRLYRKSLERTSQNNKIRLYFFVTPEDAGESLLEMKEDLSLLNGWLLL